jgi:hypothetical protein
MYSLSTSLYKVITYQGWQREQRRSNTDEEAETQWASVIEEIIKYTYSQFLKILQELQADFSDNLSDKKKRIASDYGLTFVLRPETSSTKTITT